MSSQSRLMHSSPTIFDRRSNRCGPNPPSAFKRHITVPARSDSFMANVAVNISRRPTISGFLPLPPISASPVCTPTTSTSSHDLNNYSGDEQPISSRSLSVESFNTAPTTPSDNSCSRFPPLPTWISTPPTPPPKLIKRSVTCVTRRPNSCISPSTSFPIIAKSPLPQSVPSPKRRASVPTMSSRTRSLTTSSARTKPLDSMIVASPQRTKFLPPEIFVTPSKAVQFDVAHQVSSDDDASDTAEHRSDPGTSVESSASSSGHNSTKDDIRRFHALMELLTTEVAYLLDLRILVTIYLRNIPTLKRSNASTFGRNSSFSALSRANSYAPLGNGSPMAFDHQFSNLSNKEREKSAVRHLFTDSEVDALTRNAEEMLQFHEQFVEELRLAMAPLGFPVEIPSLNWESSISPDKYREGIGNVDAGIAIVSTKFATESSRFTSYETFCAGHPEAMDIIRRAQQQYPAEWALFELKSSSVTSDMLGTSNMPPNLTSASHEALPSKTLDDSGSIASSKRRRRRGSVASLTSLDNVSWTARSRSNSANAGDRDLDSSRSKSRLVFMDYLIKPVQRICKYPLLMDQLKSKSASPVPKSPMGQTDVNVIVESAAQAMRHVASAVDEARRHQDIKVRASLITSRMNFQPVPPAFLSSSVPHPPLQVLTPTFLSSLGVCHMAGSLDTIHHRSMKAHSHTTNISVKYMGAFLYKGGYLILVKVMKGKTYEPRHWFRLSEFQITDPGEGEAWLPCSFRVSCNGHEFELAAACQQEKEAWMNAIRESLSYPVSNWIQEPVSSLQVDGKGELIPSNLDGPFEAIYSLPTIQSISELQKGNEDQSKQISAKLPASEPAFRLPPKPPDSTSVYPKEPSRRSSSTSLKTMFTPISTNSDTVIIRRPLPSSRSIVDQGLHDVVSELSTAARSQAVSREEELFQPPHVTRLGSASRSSTNSELTKSRLKKHESVRVSRCKSFVDNDDTRHSLREAIRARSLSVKKRPKKLNIASVTPEGTPFVFSQSPMESTTPPFSRPTSVTPASNSNSRANSPCTEKSFLATPNDDFDHRSGSRPSSLVGSVRGLFVSRPSSPKGSTLLPMTPVTAPSGDHDTSKSSASRFFKRWAKGGPHRRAHSAPDSKPNESFPVIPELGGFGEPLRSVKSPEQTVLLS